MSYSYNNLFSPARHHPQRFIFKTCLLRFLRKSLLIFSSTIKKKLPTALRYIPRSQGKLIVSMYIDKIAKNTCTLYNSFIELNGKNVYLQIIQRERILVFLLLQNNTITFLFNNMQHILKSSFLCR